MTGIERLRKLAGDYKSLSTKQAYIGINTRREADLLCDIADQIERETQPRSDHAADVSVSAYDLLPEEEREAVAWVRDHGGLKEVCRMFQDADNRRVELCGALGIDLDKGWSEAMAAMRLRLMPEGMEWLLEVWPRWSNGEYCRFGDWWTADRYGDYEPRQIRRLVIYTPELLDEWEQGDGESYGYEWDFMRPSELDYRPDKVEPLAPAVLAADGEPLEVGQTVWDANGDELVVGAIEDGGHTVTCRYVDVGDSIPTHGMWSPSDLTHQRPVLDADGVPIKKGERVFGINGGLYRVTSAHDGKVFARYVSGPFGAEVESAGGEGLYRLRADQLTHTKPEPIDTWQRIEEDADKETCEYFDHPAGACLTCPARDTIPCLKAKSRDLVRRCRALAERERAE